ncbi:hypothetical protein, partial [Methylomagnum sp.]
EQGQNLQRLFGKTQHRLASPIHCLGQPLSYASRLPLSANVKMAKVEKASDPNQKFTLKKSIEEARQKITELGG